MWVDAKTLHEFYTSPLGKKVSHLISDQLQKTWNNLSGKRILGIGYALPYLEDFKGKAERRLTFFPGNLGAIHWYAEGNKNRAALIEEAHFPLRDNSVDCVLIVHALEYTHIPPIDFLRNVWRVLTDSGRIIIVTPNRLGTWARFDASPFGHGHPYTSMQLSRLLKKANFTLCGSHQHALFTPPRISKRWPQLQNLGERWGIKWIGHGGGVLIQEAEKSILDFIPSGQGSLSVRALQKKRQLTAASSASSSPPLNRKSRNT